MPNSTLLALAGAAALNGSEFFYSVQSGSDVKVRADQISAYISAGISFANTTPLASYNDATVTPIVQTYGTTQNQAAFGVARFVNDATSVGNIILAKSRGAIVTDYTIVQTGDKLGEINWQGADGVNLEKFAAIWAEVDSGTVSVASTPGRLVLATTDDLTLIPSQKIVIDQAGNTLLAKNDTWIGWGQYSRFHGNTTFGAGSVNIGRPAGPWGSGASATPDYSVLQVDSGVSGADPFINIGFGSCNSAGVWLRVTSTGSTDPWYKGVQVADNSSVLFWDFLAAHEESPGFFSWNGIGNIRYDVDGAVTTASLPSRFRIYVNSGKIGYDVRMDLRADGTNMFSSTLNTSAVQNTVTDVLILRKRSDAAPGVGTGVGIRFDAKTTAGVINNVANIQVVSTNIGAGTETFDMVWKLMVGGASQQMMSLNSLGHLALSANQSILLGGTPGHFYTAENATHWGVIINTYGDHADTCGLAFSKTRALTESGLTTVQNGDRLGGFFFYGTDGGAYQHGAQLLVNVDGAPGGGNMPGKFTFYTAQAGTGSDFLFERFSIDNAGNIVVNSGVIATTATDGFLYVSSCAGPPTGVPTAKTGRIPVVVDATNNKFYFYSGGAWRDAGP